MFVLYHMEGMCVPVVHRYAYMTLARHYEGDIMYLR